MNHTLENDVSCWLRRENDFREDKLQGRKNRFIGKPLTWSSLKKKVTTDRGWDNVEES